MKRTSLTALAAFALSGLVYVLSATAGPSILEAGGFEKINKLQVGTLVTSGTYTINPAVAGSITLTSPTNAANVLTVNDANNSAIFTTGGLQASGNSSSSTFIGLVGINSRGRIYDDSNLGVINFGNTGNTATIASLDGVGDFSSSSIATTGSIVTSQLATPVNAAFTLGAGTLGTATYYYRVAALDSTGTTLASTETSLAITGPAGVNVNWGAVTGAVTYKVYGRSTGAELLMATVNAPTVTWLDNGSVTPSGALPGANTTGNIVLPGAGTAKVCLDVTCARFVYEDNNNNITLSGGNVDFANALLLFSSGNIGRVSAGTLAIGGAGQNISTLVLGTATTTTPVQIAGGSGAFVGSCAMVAGTSCTATVPSGALCMCFPQTAIGVSTNEAFGAVSSTTFTCNSGGTSNSATWTILCM